jgi:hypothetical protein
VFKEPNYILEFKDKTDFKEKNQVIAERVFLEHTIILN